MSKAPAFRILIIDDKVHETVASIDEWIKGSSSLASQHCDFVDHWLAKPDSDVEIVLAKHADLDEIFSLTAQGRIPHNREGAHVVKANPPAVVNPESWLADFHIIVLDLGDVGPPKDSENLEDLIRTHFEAIKVPLTESRPLDLLQSPLADGIKFYHRYLDHFKSAKAVIVLTAHDLGERDTLDGIQKLLWPFCREERSLPPSIPRTVVFGKAPGAGERIAAIIKAYVQEYTGFEMLLNRSQIEFAAVTDEPVLILGESGTGKEYIAASIRRAWEREKNIMKSGVRGFAVLNCGCITDATAHAHLFGAVRGTVPGSSAHEPGIILQAAGCRSLGYEKPDEWHLDTLVKALRHAESCSKAVESIGLPGNVPILPKLVKTYITELRELIYPTTSAQGHAGSRRHSLPQVLEDVKTHLQNLIAGTAEADQFKHKLLTHFDGRLVEGRAHREFGDFRVEASTNPFDLCFTKDAGVLGTLFLDEFADLPPLAQSLLLRFLESGTREIQPLGYPGIISGVRLRIIAATSDEGVAEKAGVTDDEAARKVGITPLKKRPDGRARAFPVRFDLVQRLRYHTIRVEPVTTHNARRTIESMIRTKDGVEWDEGGIKALEAYAKEQAEKATFNHRRELRRIMDLAYLHVAKGHQRGWRGFESNKITAEVVSRFLIPASAVTPASAIDENSGGTSDDDAVTIKCQATLQRVMTALKLQNKECSLECGATLMSTLKKAIRACADPAASRDAVREVFRELTRNTGRTEQIFNYKVLRKMFGYDESIAPVDQLREFFNKKIIPAKKAQSDATTDG